MQHLPTPTRTCNNYRCPFCAAHARQRGRATPASPGVNIGKSCQAAALSAPGAGRRRNRTPFIRPWPHLPASPNKQQMNQLQDRHVATVTRNDPSVAWPSVAKLTWCYRYAVPQG